MAYLARMQRNTGATDALVAEYQRHLMARLRSGVIVAASGGPDSQLLLHLLASLAEMAGVSLPVSFHLNHELRKEAAQDADLVRNTARSLDLIHYEESHDVSAFARKMRMNLESAARFLRYRDLFRATKLAGCGFCATGHHAVDFVETMILHWIRSSSREASELMPLESQLPIWSSLRKSKRFLGRLSLVRPLLVTHRKDVLELLEEFSIPFAEDSSNQDISLNRNWIRHRVIPGLEGRGLNPASLWSVHHDFAWPERHLSTEKPSVGAGPNPLNAEPEFFVRLPGPVCQNASPSELASILRASLRALALEMLPRSVVLQIYSELRTSEFGRWLRTGTSAVELWSAGGDLWIYPVNGAFMKGPEIKSISDGSDPVDSGKNYEVSWLGLTRRYSGAVLRTVQGDDLYRFRNDRRIHRSRIKTLFQKEQLPPPVRRNLPVVLDAEGYIVRACLSFLGQQDRIFFLA